MELTELHYGKGTKRRLIGWLKPFYRDGIPRRMTFVKRVDDETLAPGDMRITCLGKAENGQNNYLIEARCRAEKSET